MSRMRKLLEYVGLAAIIIAIDQFTKWWALNSLYEPRLINEFLTFDLVLNRGVSWGLLHSADSSSFIMVGLMSVSFVLILLWFTVRQWRERFSIFGETLVLAGAISNLIDRVVYKGVVDFIVLSYNDWSWPVFNIADCCIVLGTFLIITKLYKQ
ncbi:lipoprotein signal peptidase [Candidatus Dependentiae bacterium Noda2021]|nr:lipoprotein signal peptidase [Candidatus Dependentiae bacterium Noda2021]